MRLLPALLLLPLFALQVHAQPAPAASAAANPAAMPAATSASSTVQAPAGAKPRRMSWQQRFAQANATHDGHLTLQQAEQGYRTVARHFQEIDADKKGYVTIDDIANWHKLQRAMRHAHQGQSLQPRPAVQREVMQPHQVNASVANTITPTAESDQTGAATTSAGQH